VLGEPPSPFGAAPRPVVGVVSAIRRGRPSAHGNLRRALPFPRTGGPRRACVSLTQGHADSDSPTELAIICHYGSLTDADLSYPALGAYATAHEISVDGPLREYYLCDASDTPDEAEWRTEIGWPVFRADSPAFRA
jgi:hypothetical protein